MKKGAAKIPPPPNGFVPSHPIPAALIQNISQPYVPYLAKTTDPQCRSRQKDSEEKKKTKKPHCPV